METEKMKNIVVLKNINSNIVEEAFVILKPNKKAKNLKYIEAKTDEKNINKKNITNPKEYIVKEAEFIISNYISEIEKNKNNNFKFIKMEAKYKRLKVLSLILASIVLLNIFINIF